MVSLVLTPLAMDGSDSCTSIRSAVLSSSSTSMSLAPVLLSYWYTMPCSVTQLLSVVVDSVTSWVKGMRKEHEASNCTWVCTGAVVVVVGATPGGGAFGDWAALAAAIHAVWAVANCWPRTWTLPPSRVPLECAQLTHACAYWRSATTRAFHAERRPWVGAGGLFLAAWLSRTSPLQALSFAAQWPWIAEMACWSSWSLVVVGCA